MKYHVPGLAALLAASMLSIAAAAPEGLVVRWTFDEEFSLLEENVLGDGPRLGYHGKTSEERHWQPMGSGPKGLFERCMDVQDGGLVAVGGFPGGKTFTLSLWVKAETAPKNAKIFDCGKAFSCTLAPDGGSLNLTIGAKSGKASFSLGEWRSVVLAVSETEATLFVDGVRACRIAQGLTASPAGKMFVIGGPKLEGGRIDEIRLYDRALTAEEARVIADASRCMEEIPPTIRMGPHQTIFQPADRLPLTAEAQGPGRIALRWSPLKTPDGATVKFTNPEAARTEAELSRTGDYVFQLAAQNQYGTVRRTVRAVVFPRQETRASAFFQNPNRPGTWGTALPEGHFRNQEGFGAAPFSKEYKEKWFPEIELKQHPAGFARERFTPPPPPYHHPRIFFGPDDLSDIRRRAYETAVGRETMMSLKAKMLANEKDFTDPGTGLYIPYWSKTKFEKINGKYKQNFVANQYAVGAFLALLEADTAKARKIIESSMKVADIQLRRFDEIPEKDRNDWQDSYNWIVGRYAAAYVYDFLYPWMTEAERAKMRTVLSRATAGKWGLGMFCVGMAQAGNWMTWMTGELLQNALAIEGEDGFDPVVVQEAGRAMKLFCTVGLYPDGSPGGCMGKHSTCPQNYLALAKRGEMYVSTENMYNHVANYLLEIMQPYGGEVIKDGLLGSSRKAPAFCDILLLKHAYPEDEPIDYIYRTTKARISAPGGQAPEIGRHAEVGDSTIYGYTSQIFPIVMAEDVSSTLSLDAHWAQVTRGRPRSRFFEYINLVTMRSDWTRDAAYLYFQARLMGSHNRPDAGGFVFSALGRDWNYRPERGPSALYNLVVIDNMTLPSEKDTRYSKMLDYRDSELATYAAADLFWAYAWAPTDDMTLNDFRLVPHKTYPWYGLAKKDWPHWLFGDRPAAPKSAKKLAAERAAARPVKTAQRGALFVRGKQPYCLVVDDFAMTDGKTHAYTWNWTLPPEFRDGKNVELAPGRAVLTDRQTGNNCQIHLLQSAAEATPKLSQQRNKKNTEKIEEAWIAFEIKATAPEFIVLFYATSKGSAGPSWAWKGDALEIRTQDGIDRIEFTRDPKSGRRVPMLTRNSQKAW